MSPLTKDSSLTIRIPADLKMGLKEYADFNGETVTSVILSGISERLEDFYDTQAALEAIAQDDGVRYTIDEVATELGIDL